VAALVGMAALFSGASRALLASIVFAFETTLQPMGLLPLLGGCTAAYLVSCILMRHTIMTEKIARRGIRVPAEYAADFLDQVAVRDAASAPVVMLEGAATLEKTRAWLASRVEGTQHQGYPVADEYGRLLGVVTRRDLLDPARQEDRTLAEMVHRAPVVAFADNSLREAADHMVREKVGRLPVVSRTDPERVVGIITRSDLLAAHERRLKEATHVRRHLRVRRALARRLNGVRTLGRGG
jgi:CBS domain-containing protein